MNTTLRKQGNYTLIIILGAIILLTRTIIMIANGYLIVFVEWVALLLFTEFLFDLAWMMTAVRWYLTKDNSKASLALRLAAIAIIVHAFRVLIYVLGRVGKQANYDIKPEYRVSPYTDWELGWVYFAAIMSVMGIIGVIVVWRLLHNAKKKKLQKNKIMTNKRDFSFWVLIITSLLLVIFLLAGQSFSLINYEAAVSLGLQESVEEIGEVGIAFAKGFAFGDSIIYIPLLIGGIIGLLKWKKWGVFAMLASCSISVYWPLVHLYAIYIGKDAITLQAEKYVTFPITLTLITAYGLWGIWYLYKNQNIAH